MKQLLSLLVVALLIGAASVVLNAQDGKAKGKVKAKPYALKTCLVTDEKLGGMGKPFVFEHEGQEIKLCCKSCKEDFEKDTAKFLKKLADSEKKPKK